MMSHDDVNKRQGAFLQSIEENEAIFKINIQELWEISKNLETSWRVVKPCSQTRVKSCVGNIFNVDLMIWELFEILNFGGETILAVIYRCDWHEIVGLEALNSTNTNSKCEP